MKLTLLPCRPKIISKDFIFFPFLQPEKRIFMKFVRIISLMAVFFLAQSAFSKLLNSDRISLLEESVRNLQNRVQFLESKLLKQSEKSNHKQKKDYVEVEENLWSCYLRDSFGKVFTAKGFSESEAKGLTLQECGGGIHCKKEKLTCSHEKKVTVKKNHEKQKEAYNKTWSCFIQNQMGKTFIGHGETQSEAGGQALKACGSIFCKEKDLSCSHT